MLSTPGSPVTSEQPHLRSVTLLIWCAAASLGLLFIKVDSGLSFAPLQSMAPVAAATNVSTYILIAVPVLALLVWHVYPRRSWPWLLLAGAVCAALNPLFHLVPGLYSTWMQEPLMVVVGSAPMFTLVGILAATTVVWHAGRRSTGAVLTGTALVLQLVGPVVLGSIFTGDVFLGGTESFWVASLVLVVVAVAGAVGAILAKPWQATRPPARPSWRVTIAGALVTLAGPVLVLIWQPRPAASTRISGNALALLGNDFLYIGLVFLAIGLVAGAAAGQRALLTSAAAGLMLGTFGMLITPSVEVLREMVTITVIAAVGSMLLGYVIALSRWRAQFGTGGIATVALGLIVLAVLFASDEPYASYATFSRVLTPVLLVIGIAAAVSALSSIGATLAERSETPAVLAGLTTAFSLGTIAVIAHFSLHKPADKASLAGLLPPAAGAMLVAAALIGIIAVGARREE